MNTTNFTIWAVAVSTLLCLQGCELEGSGNEDSYDSDPCGTSSGPSDVAGNWRIRAEGDRFSCNDPDFNGYVLVRTNSFEVEQTQDPDDEDTDDLSLTEAVSVPGGSVTITGTVRGSCVDFTLLESGDGGRYEYVFDGTEQGGRIAGTFRADGPPGCVTTGSFEIE